MGKKKPLSEKAVHEEEKYKFIKEQIKPQRRRLLLKHAKIIVSTLVLAVVFGGVAGVVFHAVNVKLEENSNSNSEWAKETATALDSPTVIEDESENENVNSSDEKISGIDLDNINNYNYVRRKLAAIGAEYNTSIVTVHGSYQDGSLFKDNLSSVYGVDCGIIYKETANMFYLFTSADFIGNEESVKVEFFSGETVEAQYVAGDSSINLTVLAIRKKNVTDSTKTQIEPLSISSTSKDTVGSTVIAVGAPDGTMNSVMVGNIVKSNIKESITDNVISLATTDINYISEGNGVVLNTKGKIVGIITHEYVNTTGIAGLSFVSIESIYDVINLLTAGKSSTYLGVEGCDVDETTAQQYKLEIGVYVSSVYSGSPAYEGGMRAADVITKIDDVKIKSMNQIHTLLRSHSEGDEITVCVKRKSNHKTSTKKLKIVLS